MSKRYMIVSRGDEESSKLKNRIEQILDLHAWTLTESNPEIVISIGGDGTMLEAFHRYSHQLEDVAFVGVNTGHLGFYTDWKKEEIYDLIELILNDEPRVVRYPLVEMTLNGETKYALNEVTIRNGYRSLICDLYINGQMFESFRGDGLLISTPSGSTAYNKSVNGAVVHPLISCLQISEIASINNESYRTLNSSMVLPENHIIEIKIHNAAEDLIIPVDHLSIKPNDQINELKFKVSDKKVNFLRYKEYTFWNRVREAFIGSKR